VSCRMNRSSFGMNSLGSSDNPLVSILIPAYNCPDFLDDCLNSILRQDYKNLEIIIKDDCSEEVNGMLTVAKKYGTLFDLGENFKYVRNEVNLGYVQNKHDGVANCCTGKYCLIMDHDDFFLTDKIIRLYVEAFQSSERIVVVSADVELYYQNNNPKSPKEIIADNSSRLISEEKNIIDGNEYFLGFWNKFCPRQPAVTMFDRQLAIERNWPNAECNDQSIPLLLSPGNKVAIFYDKLGIYRRYDSSVTKNVFAEMVFASHTAIANWIDSAKEYSNISRFSLFVWRLKNILLKDEGPIRWLHGQNEGKLREYFALLRNYKYLDYYVQKYLSPQMIAYDYEKASKSKNRFIRFLLKVMIGTRWATSKLILGTDRILHDPEYRSKCRIDRLFYDAEYRYSFSRKVSRLSIGIKDVFLR
jgi:glycosyltransferase involved in cell wall biosynthesis